MSPSIPFSLLPFACLFAGAICLAFSKRFQSYVPTVLVAAGVLAFPAGLVRVEGITGLAAGAGLLWMQSRTEMSDRARVAARIALVLLALALALHHVPGFAPLTWPGGFSREAARDLVWPFDKAAAALLLLGLVGVRPGRVPITHGLPGVAGGACLIAALAVAAGLTQWSPAIPAGLGPWIVANLMIVALAEETFFRGLLQNGLERLLTPHTTHAGTIALLTVAVLFGLAHLPWGAGFACGAVLAGVFYGIAFRAGGLIAAVFAHALTNTAIVLLSHSALG